MPALEGTRRDRGHRRTRHQRRTAVTVIGMAGLALVSAGLLAPQATASARWHEEPDAMHGTYHSLQAISGSSPDDIWVVGNQSLDVEHPRTWLKHWDGETWTRVHGPNPSHSADDLAGVATVSAGDVWAVGDMLGPDDVLRALIQHWDGTAWRTVSFTEPSGNSGLQAVSAVSATNVWAVGYAGGWDDTHAVAEHWNGSAWSESEVPLPPDSTESTLYAIDARTANDIWAVGYVDVPGGGGRVRQPLVEHWNGSGWTSLPTPAQAGLTSLMGVTAVASDDVWAVGAVGMSDSVALVEHWDGTAWSVVDTPSPAGVSQLDGVDATAADDVWAVGYSGNPIHHSDSLIEHWDGSSWQVVPSANPSHVRNILSAVGAWAGDDAWAVGYVTKHSLGKNLFERWDGSSWVALPRH